MPTTDYDGSRVLERLAALGKLDAFYEAIDADDFVRAKALMKEARLDAETIATTLKKMADADGDH